jgi:hypothetical protein
MKRSGSAHKEFISNAAALRVMSLMIGCKPNVNSMVMRRKKAIRAKPKDKDQEQPVDTV